MTPEEKPAVSALVSKWLQRKEHKDVRAGDVRFGRLIAAAVYRVRYGKPLNRLQRLAYRSHRKRRANKALLEAYGDPKAANPKGSKA